MQKQELIESLNGRFSQKRLHSLKKLKENYLTDDVICTGKRVLSLSSSYSFGPYTPTMLAYMGYNSGCKTLGITDYLTLKGAKEFIKASKTLGMSYATGVRIETFDGAERNLVTVLGVPQNKIKAFDLSLLTYRDAKRQSIVKLIDNINAKYQTYGIRITRDDILNSRHFGKAVLTHKHVFYVLAEKIINVLSKGERIVEFLINKIGLTLSDEQKSLLSDSENPYYVYDLENAVQSVDYFTPISGLPTLGDAVKLGKSKYGLCFIETRERTLQGIKKVISNAVKVKADGVAFKTSALSDDEITEVCKLLEDNELLSVNLQIMDEPRKKYSRDSFGEYADEVFARSADVIVGHEIAVNNSLGDGFNSENIKSSCKDFKDRTTLFSNIIKRDK